MENRFNTAVGVGGRGMSNWRTTNNNVNGRPGRGYFQLDITVDIKCSLNHRITPGFFFQIVQWYLSIQRAQLIHLE